MPGTLLVPPFRPVGGTGWFSRKGGGGIVADLRWPDPIPGTYRRFAWYWTQGGSWQTTGFINFFNADGQGIFFPQTSVPLPNGDSVSAYCEIEFEEIVGSDIVNTYWPSNVISHTPAFDPFFVMDTIDYFSTPSTGLNSFITVNWHAQPDGLVGDFGGDLNFLGLYSAPDPPPIIWEGNYTGGSFVDGWSPVATFMPLTSTSRTFLAPNHVKRWYVLRLGYTGGESGISNMLSFKPGIEDVISTQGAWGVLAK